MAEPLACALRDFPEPVRGQPIVGVVASYAGAVEDERGVLWESNPPCSASSRLSRHR